MGSWPESPLDEDAILQNEESPDAWEGNYLNTGPDSNFDPSTFNPNLAFSQIDFISTSGGPHIFGHSTTTALHNVETGEERINVTQVNGRFEGGAGVINSPVNRDSIGSAEANASICHNNACDCGKIFTNSGQLARHLAVKTSKYCCSHCGKSFGSKSDMRRHCTEVHGVTPNGVAAQKYPCPRDDCHRNGEPFLRKANLDAHMKNCHTEADTTAQGFPLRQKLDTNEISFQDDFQLYPIRNEPLLDTSPNSRKKRNRYSNSQDQQRTRPPRERSGSDHVGTPLLVHDSIPEGSAPALIDLHKLEEKREAIITDYKNNTAPHVARLRELKFQYLQDIEKLDCDISRLKTNYIALDERNDTAP